MRAILLILEKAIARYIRDDEYRYVEADGIRALVPPIVQIPAGAFTMGNDAHTDESPAHAVTLPDYAIARYPVTVEEYQLFLLATKHAEPSSVGSVFWANQIRADHLQHPVVNVTWHEAVAYARWLSQMTGQPWRLPTEAEWEKAARWDAAAKQPHALIYPWGNEWDQAKANTVESNTHGTTKVTAHRMNKSPYGVCDMVGNVWEWTASLSKPYSEQAHTQSATEQEAGMRVRRGGSWQDNHTSATTTRRIGSNPTQGNPSLGFRLVFS